jgi:hypothetical protein
VRRRFQPQNNVVTLYDSDARASPCCFFSCPHDQGALLKLVIWFQIRQGLLDAKIGPFIITQSR